jgi:hypothetical protein
LDKKDCSGRVHSWIIGFAWRHESATSYLVCVLHVFLNRGCFADQKNSGAVTTLVDKMCMEAVEIHIGTADVVFGWSAFGLAILATIGVTAIVIADWGVAAAQAKALAKSEELLANATGGRLQMKDLRTDVENYPAKPDSTHPSLGTSSLRGVAMEKGIDFGKKQAMSMLRRK